MHGRLLAAPVAALISLILPAAASAAIFPVTNGNDSGAGSLRNAIDLANANDNQATVRDSIQIDNDGMVPFSTIAVVNTALTVTETVFISADQPVTLTASGTAHDGLVFTAAAGSATPALQPATLRVSASGFTNGVVAQAQGLSVDTATLSGSTAAGIDISGADVFVVRSTLSGNATGAFVDGDGAVIGGTLAQRNVIAGNTVAGVSVTSDGTDANVSHNFIGTNAAGTVAQPNLIGLSVGATGAQVFDNLISGNTVVGVQLGQCATLIRNTIGLGTGGTALPNSGGVEVAGNGCLVGSSTPGDGNVVSGNSSAGVVVSGDDAVVQGNTIGSNGAGNATGVIVDSASGAVIGGPGSAANTIRFNTTQGIDLTDAPDSTVNGNTIRTNGGVGVRGTGTSTVEALGNAIFENGGLGIDVAGTAPAITSVASGGGKLRARGSFTAAGSGGYTVELFANDACDISGSGEGQTPLGTAAVVSAGAGTAQFDLQIDAAVASPKSITLTVTRQRAGQPGVTTKFSNCVQIAATAETSFATGTASVGEGAGQATIHVIRSGSVAGASTVDFATSNGSATAGQDYTATSGTLSFAAGESDKTFAVPLIDDNVAENPQTFTVTLANPSGSALGAPSAQTVTITSNDEGGLVVNNAGDTSDGTCNVAHCTLREAILASNASLAGRDTITFTEGLGTIALTGDLPEISEPVLIAGPATIDGNGVASAIRVLPAAGGTNSNDDTELFDGIRIEDTSGPAVDVDGARFVVQDSTLLGHDGIRFHGAASGAVGGSAGHGNTITPAGGDGVLVEAPADVNVSHNAIDASGGSDGVVVGATATLVFDNTVKGGAGGAGIVLDACADVLVRNTAGGAGDGIAVRASGCLVGSSGQGDGNVVTGASGSGIVVEQGGTDVIGNEVKGNTADGVRVTAGTGTRLIGNTIRENGGRGVAVANGAGALLRGNSITANGGLGIDVAPDGVTAGAPVLSAVKREGGKLRLTGTLPAPVAGQYDLEVSTDSACDPSGFGEGATAVAVIAVLAAAPGNVALDFLVDADAPAGTIVAVTATRAGSTSEYSGCVAVTEGAGGGGTPPPGGGGTPPPTTQADPQSQITSPRGRVRSRRLKRIRGTAQDAARVDIAAIRIKDGKCYALRRNGRFRLRTGPGRCSPARFFRATGTTTWSFKLNRRFRPGRYRIYSRATAADGTREAPPARVRVRVRR